MLEPLENAIVRTVGAATRALDAGPKIADKARNAKTIKDKFE